jgi:predicted RNase H-like nuclease (RuvC/YqgF family)
VQNELIATNRRLTLQVSDLLVERRELHADAGRLRAALVGRLERTSDMSPQDIAELQGEVEKLKTENEGFRERAMEQGAEVERLKSENAMAANDIIQRNATCARQLLEAGAEIGRLTDKVANRDRLLAMADAASWDLLKERERVLNAEIERLTEAARRSDLYARSNQAELGAQVERLTAALKDLRERSVEEGIQHFVKRIDVALS